MNANLDRKIFYIMKYDLKVNFRIIDYREVLYFFYFHAF